MLCGTGDCPASSEREPVCLRTRAQSWYTLWATESLGETTKQWGASSFNFNNLLKGKKKSYKITLALWRQGLNSTNSCSGEELCCYSKELSSLFCKRCVPAAGQNHAEICHILLYISDPWWCLSQHHRLYRIQLLQMFSWEYLQREVPCDEKMWTWM